MNDKLVRLSDAISAVLEEKISGQQLEIMRALGTGLQVETLNQACDRHAQYIRDLPAVDAVEVCRCKDCRYGTIDQYSAGEYVVVCEAPKKQRGHYDVYALDWYCPMGQRREDGDGNVD